MSGLLTLHGLPHETDSTAEGATLYASLGWQVFPCAGKRPINADGFKGASADSESVAAMWQANPTANVGWAVPVGWFALDVDPRHGGDVSLRELEREHEPLPWTLRAKTGGGGEHWIYRVPAGVEIRQMAGFRPGLDTRLGGRGYLLVCPSVHPETGKPYRWYATLEPTEPPAWLVDIVKAPPAPPPVVYTPPTFGRALDSRGRMARAALAAMAKRMAESTKGGRNDLLNWCWFKMAAYQDVVPLSETAYELRQAALASGLAEREIEKVLRR